MIHKRDELDSLFFSYYKNILAEAIDMDKINEPLSIFVPRIDYYLSYFSLVNQIRYNTGLLRKLFKGNLLEYLITLHELGFLGRFGNTINLNAYILNFEKLGIQYHWIPKNACTFAKKTFVKYNSPEALNQIQADRFHEDCQDIFGSNAENLNTSIKTLKPVMIFREPIERLVSCYTDKFMLPVVSNKPFENFIRSTISRIHEHHGVKGNNLRRSVTFLEFVIFVLQQPAHSLDSHWRPQNDFVSKNLHYDFMTTENLGSNLYKLINIGSSDTVFLERSNKSVGLAFDSSKRLSGHLADTLPSDIQLDKITSYNDFLSPSLFHLLTKFYKEDYEIFSKIK